MPNWPVEILQNKYTRWYEQIVLRAQSRTLPADTYTETHHIIPRSLGGDNSHQNLAKLTGREHFICHWLLTKMFLNGSTERGKMFYALQMLKANNAYHKRYSTLITSRVYENLKQILSVIGKGKEPWNKGKKIGPPNEETRKKLSIANKGTIPWIKGKKLPPRNEEWCKKISESNKGRNPTEETRKKISTANKGKKLPLRTKEHSKKISESKKRDYASGKHVPWNKGKKRPPFSEEWRKKLGAANIGRKSSKETREKLSKALKGIPRTEIWNKRNSLAKSRPVKTPEGCFIKYRLAVEHYMPIWDLRYGGADWRLRKLFDDPSNNEFTRISMEEYKKLIGENNA